MGRIWIQCFYSTDELKQNNKEFLAKEAAKAVGQSEQECLVIANSVQILLHQAVLAVRPH